MSYTHPDLTKPAPTNARTADINAIRTNTLAIIDGIFMGTLASWATSMVIGAGTEDQPQYYYHRKGNDWIRQTLTWDGNGNVATIVYARSTNGGTDWDTIGARTCTYTANGYFDHDAWS